ncbi:MAG: TRAP transporter large permease [Deltaproteobacteria bacterium]|nr:TRAP transporter large permease [Deltaproteobacteria bacterium]
MHGSEMYAHASFVLGVMVVSFIAIFIAGKKLKQDIPIAVILFLICVIGALAGGYGVPVRHLFEGMSFYIYINLVILTGMVFLQVMKSSGNLDAITWDILMGFHRRPIILFCLLTLILFLPGMVTGIGTAAVLTTGTFVAVILMTLGIPRTETAVILALVTTFGAAAPPVNLPAMIISGGINMPYSGFSLVLLLLTVPAGLFSFFWIGYRHFKVLSREEIKKKLPEPERPNAWMPYVPIGVVAVLFLLIRFFPFHMIDLITPAVFMIGSLVGLFTGKKVNYFKASKEAMSGGLFTVVALLFVVGTVVQITTLSGVKGLLVIGALTISSFSVAILYFVMALSLPLLGGVLTHLGAAAILGVPFALALLTKNAIIVVAAASIFCVIAQLVPPSAVGGYFAKQVTELKTYAPILKKCIVPVIVSSIWTILVMIFANPISKILI